jgi:hypothetical protein
MMGLTSFLSSSPLTSPSSSSSDSTLTLPSSVPFLKTSPSSRVSDRLWLSMGDLGDSWLGSMSSGWERSMAAGGGSRDSMLLELLGDFLDGDAIESSDTFEEASSSSESSESVILNEGEERLPRVDGEGGRISSLLTWFGRGLAEAGGRGGPASRS